MLKNKALGCLSVLSLLPFFQHFRDDSPYHLAGVAALQEAMPAELLQDEVVAHVELDEDIVALAFPFVCIFVAVWQCHCLPPTRSFGRH